MQAIWLIYELNTQFKKNPDICCRQQMTITYRVEKREIKREESTSCELDLSM
jgi:hypothetical protein